MKRILFATLSSFLFIGCAGAPSGGFDEVVIDSNPPGAIVVVNGAERGRTPLGLTLASNQNHTLIFKHADYPDKVLELHRHLMATSVSIQVLFDSTAPRARIGSDLAPGEDLTVVYGNVNEERAPFARRQAPAPKPVEEPAPEPVVEPAPTPVPEPVQVDSPTPDADTGLEQQGAPEVEAAVVEEAKPKEPQIERCTRCRRNATTGSKYCEVHGG